MVQSRKLPLPWAGSPEPALFLTQCTHTQTRTHTRTHTSLPSLEGLEGNVHVAFHGEQKKAKVLDTGQVSVSPASGSLQVAVGCEPREMEEWVSGPHPGQAWLHV